MKTCTEKRTIRGLPKMRCELLSELGFYTYTEIENDACTAYLAKDVEPDIYRGLHLRHRSKWQRFLDRFWRGAHYVVKQWYSSSFKNQSFWQELFEGPVDEDMNIYHLDLQAYFYAHATPGETWVWRLSGGKYRMLSATKFPLEVLDPKSFAGTEYRV